MCRRPPVTRAQPSDRESMNKNRQLWLGPIMLGAVGLFAFAATALHFAPMNVSASASDARTTFRSGINEQKPATVAWSNYARRRRLVCVRGHSASLCADECVGVRQ